MNTFAEVMASLRKRAAGGRIMRTLDALEELKVLDGIPDGSGKKSHVRLPYSSDPRSFEEPWK